MMDEPFWQAAREQMLLDPTVANLNTGSFGPLSRRVFDRVTELRRRLAEEPMCFLLREAPALLWQAREDLADFLDWSPERLVFTANVTAAINLVASSLTLAAPGEILLSDHEYEAMLWCWERMAQRQGLAVRTFPVPLMAHDPEEVVEAACDRMSPRTRLLFFSHVLSPTGMVLPAQRLCEEARNRGIVTVIDGAHAPAYVPLSLNAIPFDYYCGNCHKWLLAPTGSGFLAMGRGREDSLQPLQVSWGWKRPPREQRDQPDIYGSTPRSRFLEWEGVRDPCPWISSATAIDFQRELGPEKIQNRIRYLTDYVRETFTDRNGLSLITPGQDDLRGAMTAFRLPKGLSAELLRDHFWRHRIEVPIVERPEGLILRVSTHFYNTVAEVDLLAEAMAALPQA